MRNPAFGRWPTDDDPARDLPVRAVAVPGRDLLAEAEERVDRRPAVRRERRPYRGARQDRTGLVEAAMRAVSLRPQKSDARR